jgi:hypothetical protein
MKKSYFLDKKYQNFKKIPKSGKLYRLAGVPRLTKPTAH